MSRPADAFPPELARYARQLLLPQIGVTGQRKLASARVVVIGVGALGAALSSSLVRAGVGMVRVVDRDYITLDNLPRQTLFDERDIAQGLPKAEAAARKLRLANSTARVEPVIQDVNAASVEKLIDGVDLVLDGSDNFEVRLLLNDACLKHGLPWIYGGAIGTSGCIMTIIPGDGPCFRCLLPSLPAPGSVPTGETAGVLGSVPHAVAALQAAEALKLLTGQRQALVRSLRFIELWEGTMDTVRVTKGPTPCPACDEGRFEFLDGARQTGGAKMCGRAAVQVEPGRQAAPDFQVLAQRLAALGEVSFNEFMLRFQTPETEIALFLDGRAIIKGPTDEASARAIYSRFVGS